MGSIILAISADFASWVCQVGAKLLDRDQTAYSPVTRASCRCICSVNQGELGMPNRGKVYPRPNGLLFTGYSSFWSVLLFRQSVQHLIDTWLSIVAETSFEGK